MTKQKVETVGDTIQEQPSSGRDWIAELRASPQPEYRLAFEALDDLEKIGFDTAPARDLLDQYNQLMQEYEAIENELKTMRPSPFLRERVTELTNLKESIRPSAEAILREFLMTVAALRISAYYERGQMLQPFNDRIDQADESLIAALNDFEAGLAAATSVRQERQDIADVFRRIYEAYPDLESFGCAWQAPWGREIRRSRDEIERVFRRRHGELREQFRGKQLTLQDFRTPPNWH